MSGPLFSARAALSAAVFVITIAEGHAGAATDSVPLATVSALEGSGEVAIARLEAFGRTRRLQWDEKGTDGATYGGIAADEVTITLRVEGEPAERADAIAILERFASPDPALHRPPLVAVKTPGIELRGLVGSLAYECGAEHCQVRIVVIPRTPPDAAKPAVAEAKAEGYLTLDTYPWTSVTENGRVIGNTPLVHVPLAPGAHKLVLENRALGIRQTYAITIESGRATARRLGLR